MNEQLVDEENPDQRRFLEIHVISQADGVLEWQEVFSLLTKGHKFLDLCPRQVYVSGWIRSSRACNFINPFLKKYYFFAFIFHSSFFHFHRHDFSFTVLYSQRQWSETVQLRTSVLIWKKWNQNHEQHFLGRQSILTVPSLCSQHVYQLSAKKHLPGLDEGYWIASCA